jgi:hypothetical protein
LVASSDTQTSASPAAGQPLLWVVLDEGVLRRSIGDRKVMRAQAEHLVEMAGRPNVVIQVFTEPIRTSA